jgi:hypothetical protein
MRFPRTNSGMARAEPPGAGLTVRVGGQATPSFFCRLVEDVVYWNVSRFSG